MESLNYDIFKAKITASLNKGKTLFEEGEDHAQKLEGFEIYKKSLEFLMQAYKSIKILRFLIF